LEGIYYPGAYSPGPVIVLMHWAGGDMRDWDAIAPWLQNRGGQPFGIGDGSSWWDPSWFPELPEWASFSVLVFNFGGFGISQGSRETLALDAKAAVDFASMQSNVDPGLVSTMGASIGADGSVDGCYLHQMDSNSLGTCLGGFSLSPGNFQQDSTNFPYTYAETVQGLLGSGEAMKVAYCLAAQGDGTSPDTCKSVSGYESTYHRYIYPGNAHGMNLIAPDLFPQDPAVNMNALQIYLEFLQEVYQVDFSQ
jgi:dienelactone hydrolase